MAETNVQQTERLPVPPLLLLGMILLGLGLPVISIRRWDDWDSFRWTLEVVQWTILDLGLLFSCRNPAVLWRLRHVPWFAGMIWAIEGGYALMHQRLDAEVSIILIWWTVVGVLFLIMPRRYPTHFAKPPLSGW